MNIKQLPGLTFLIAFLGLQLPGNAETIQADVVIYGGTSAAVMAAVQLAQADKEVVIVCPDQHLGGLSSGGLGFTDTGNKAVIGGLAREFYQRIYDHYQKEEAWRWQAKSEYGNVGQGTPAIDGDKRTMWIFEPHVAEGVFEDFVEEYGIKVFRNHWLDRQNGVSMEEGRIVSIQMLNERIFKGKVFIDATYEGDLMAAAGVSYHVGRESNDTYNETWNGVQVGVLHHQHHFGDTKISPYVLPDDPESGLLYGVSPTPPGEKGAGDHRLQAYCFRMCLTKVDENKVPIPKPENYDPSNYELLVRILGSGWDGTFNKFDPIPNLKTDVNNHGPFSFDFIGMNYEYPEADYEQRKAIIQEHEDYQKGLLYFYKTDPRVPSSIQEEMKKWGLAKDEFTDNGHWPHQIYVREARRMIGAYVMTEHEVLGHRQVPNSIGMGSYVMDSHNTQRYITPEGFVQNEGDIGVKPKQPYQIDMGSILPEQAECTNLIVPVAVSSSHIAFGSIRMEPVFMILGQSAAVIAEHAIENNIDVQDVEYTGIKKDLEEVGQILSFEKP
ncbi:MAG: FAD-dependent oxidoreductase [Phaeodactylibacter sp.]|uniref:FAD-dependent oxidoreductase n=1 Tax=Phaeodactylibacter sp. TaxID=1940289 RepID=UPI0032EB7787